MILACMRMKIIEDVLTLHNFATKFMGFSQFINSFKNGIVCDLLK